MRQLNFRHGGYTLTEVMIATGVAALIALATSVFFVRGLGVSYMTAGKLQVSHDVRKFTNELSTEARNASYFQVFPGFAEREEPVRDNRSGDLLVLYFLNTTGELERLVGYYRAADQGDEGPVRKFDLPMGSGGEPTLPSPTLVDDFPMVIEVSRGLADGRLFHNFYDRSVLVRGEIIHQGNLIRRATNTYNFTVSPRG